MPEVSRFFGVVISMYWEASEPHHAPHFHVRYEAYRASYGIDPVAQLAGALPIRQQRLVEAWAELHTRELLNNWDLLEHGQRPLRIKGLD